MEPWSNSTIKSELLLVWICFLTEEYNLLPATYFKHFKIDGSSLGVVKMRF